MHGGCVTNLRLSLFCEQMRGHPLMGGQNYRNTQLLFVVLAPGSGPNACLLRSVLVAFILFPNNVHKFSPIAPDTPAFLLL
jgi:hypothetical protein